jgi:hypothetical protein
MFQQTVHILFFGGRPRADGSPTENLPHLHMPPSATIGGGDLPSVELPA